uniref:Vacuolar protein sorting-associated protein 53 homolog n=1 Tax=Onchocerca volvulus TaxID=6282 RepID=A0A8R1TZN8_ONCVO
MNENATNCGNDVGRNVADVEDFISRVVWVLMRNMNKTLENNLETKKSESPENVGDDVTFSDRVIRTIVSLSDAGLCSANMDVVDQINALFPTEQSLSQLDSVMHSVEDEVVSLDCELAKLVEMHGKAGAEGDQALHEAHAAMGDLEEHVRAVCLKTQSSENVVQEMTRDIKQLDVAKRNLISSLKALHHLQILLTGVYSLGSWIDQHRYGDIASQLPAVLNVLQLFGPYMEVEHIKNVAEQLERLKQRLAIQLVADLKHSFQTGVLNSSVTDMCRVASSLDPAIREDFCKWFIEHQLSEYTVLYGESESIAWIDKIDSRYRWFVQKLTEFEKTGVMKVFPTDWNMGRRLTLGYCNLTREMLERMMSRRWLELDYKVLAHAINHTIMFENLLCKRFPAKEIYNFEKIIWRAFDKYMDVFVAAQKKNLDSFLEECVIKIRSGAERPSRETASHAYPLPSSADMFLLLKKIIAESTKLSSNPNALLRNLVEVLRNCLRGYAHGCLTAFLPSLSSTQFSSTSILQTLMRDETAVRLTVDQQFFTCCILATADWCAETTLQLQEKLKQRVQSIDLNQEMELFYSISNNALSVLVQDVESTCDAALQTMVKKNWNGVESVGDESLYVSLIRSHLRSNVPLIRDFFIDRRKYFAHFCLKLATQLVNKFLGALFRCRPVGVAGAEQLLLDAHALKTFLLSMPTIESSINTKPPMMYTNVVVRTMTKVEMILKIVMSEIDSPEDFVMAYVRLLPDSDSSELQKVLEMKALRRQEQTSIIQLYKSRIEVQPTAEDSCCRHSVIGDLSIRKYWRFEHEKIGTASEKESLIYGCEVMNCSFNCEEKEIRMSKGCSKKLSFELPLFFAYVTGNDACDVLLELERKYDIKFIISEDSVYVEGSVEPNQKAIKEALSTAWKMDNFQRAIEIYELTNNSDYQFLFEVSPSEAALIQLNAKTLLHRTGVLQLKTDSNGHVCIFGNGGSVCDTYDTIVSIFRKASSKSDTAKQGFSGEPCILLMNIPSAIAQFVFSNDKRSVNALERSGRCVVEPHFNDIDAVGNIKVDIITKDLANALAIKTALMELIESHVGKIHKWPTPITICCGSRVSRSIPELSCRTCMYFLVLLKYYFGFEKITHWPNSSVIYEYFPVDECEAVLYGPTDKSLTFSVPASEASRLIGIRGANKKRIEGRTNCCISLHTEAKYGGEFPVEIIGQNVKQCEAAQRYIQNFLKETPGINKNLTGSSSSITVQSSQPFNSQLKLSHLDALSPICS